MYTQHCNKQIQGHDLIQKDALAWWIAGNDEVIEAHKFKLDVLFEMSYRIHTD